MPAVVVGERQSFFEVGAVLRAISFEEAVAVDDEFGVLVFGLRVASFRDQALRFLKQQRRHRGGHGDNEKVGAYASFILPAPPYV